MMELLDNGLDDLVVEPFNQCRKRERGGCGVMGLIMIATYNQVGNSLGLHLKYSHIL